MGNRAVITVGRDDNNLGIYVHWNGGPESVLAFLETAKARGYRCPKSDETYGMARLVGVIHEFFGVDSSTSLGIGTLKTLDCDNYDNGVYVVGRNWAITDRWGKGHDATKTVEQLSNGQKERYNAIVNDLQLSYKKNSG